MPRIHVQRDRAGAWEVTLSERETCVTCETLDDARRIGYQWAAQCHPCELIVHDAYHRVIQREFIDGDGAHSGSRERRAASRTARRSRRP